MVEKQGVSKVGGVEQGPFALSGLLRCTLTLGNIG
jgi:hypothetical protein